MKTPIGLAVIAIVEIADASASPDEKETLMGVVSLLENGIKPKERLSIESAFINGEISAMRMMLGDDEFDENRGKERADDYYNKEYL